MAEGVAALTKNNSLLTKQEKMQDSLSRIKETFKEVAIVKLADRITNLQTPPHTWNLEKIENYKEEAKLIANDLKGLNAYLDQRIRSKIKEYAS